MPLNLPFKNLWDHFAQSEPEIEGYFNKSQDQLNTEELDFSKFVNRKQKVKDKTLKRKFRSRLLWRLFPNPVIRDLIRQINEHDINIHTLLDESAILFFTDSKGYIEYANKQFCQTSGYTLDEIKDNHCRLLKSGYHNSSFIKNIYTELMSGKVWKGEMMHKTKAGSFFWVYSVIIPIFDQYKNPVKFLNISHDITEAKEANRNTDIFVKMLEHVSDAVVVSDFDGSIIYANLSASKLFGHSVGKLKSKTVRAIEPYFSSEKKWDAHLKTLRNKGNVLFESNYNGKHNQQTIPVEVSATLIKIEQKEYIVSTIRDISDRKTKELLEKETEIKTSHLLSNLNDFVAIVDAKGLIQYQSPSIKQRLGIEPEELLQTPFENLLAKADRKTFRKILKNNITEPQKYFQFVAKNKTIYVNINIQDKLNDPLVNGFIISCRDVTDMKMKMQELDRQKEMYRLLSDNNKDLICLHKPNGEYIYTSASVEDMLGYKPDELIGKSPYNYIHEKDIDHIIDAARKNKHKGILNNIFQHRFRRKDGSYIWVETITKPILDESGNCIQLQSSTRDITDKILSELALKQSDRRYKELIKHSQAIITSQDKEGRIISVNPVFEEIMGYKQHEVIGKKISDFIPKHHRAEYKNTYLKELNKKGSMKGIVKMLSRKNESVYLHFNEFKVSDSDSREYFNSIAIDVTEQIRYENELRKAKLKAEEAVKAKEIFLANMSHEIRTPLNGILGISDLLNKTKLNEEQSNFVDVIQNSGQNLLVIINDVLDLAKIESGEFKLENITFNLSETIDALVKPFMYKAEEQDLKLEIIPFYDKNTVIEGDPYRLNQILNNLLNNAIKFTENGSVTLDGEVLHEDKESIEYCFYVKDTGKGIPKNKQNEIFENFKQVLKPGSAVTTGTGLGLSIVKKLVGMMGGKVWVESKPGYGSTFYFTLKFKKGKCKNIPIKHKPKLNHQLIEGKKILIAEDNQVNQMLVESILKGWRVDYKIASDGQEAMKYFLDEEFDLILLDIQMPKLSGMDVIKKIRKNKNKNKNKIPVIALTANAFKGQRKEYLSAGMDNYLSKPFKENELLSVIFETLEINTNESLNLPVNCSNPNLETIKDVNLEESKNSNVMVEFKMDNVKEITGNDQEMLNQIIDLFIETVPVTVAEIKTAVRGENWEEAGSRVHKLKGSVVTFDVQPTTALLIEMEKDLKSNQNIDTIPERTALLEQQIDFLIAELNQAK